jgi:hypothetical protein
VSYPDGDNVTERATAHQTARAHLYADITNAPTRHIRLADRWALAEHLLLQGWQPAATPSVDNPRSPE